MSIKNLMLDTENTIIGIAIIVVTVVCLIAYLIVKYIIQKKNVDKLYKSITVGVYVETLSGICGKVLAIKESSEIIFLLLQTGDTTHKSYVTIDISSVDRIIDDPKEILKDEIKVKEQKNLKTKI